MRRVLFVLLLVALALPSAAGAHSIVRLNGTEVTYLSSDATSLNDLTLRQVGQDLELRDPTVDGGIDYGTCRPGETDSSGFVVQTFCARSGLTLVRIDLGEREDELDVQLPIAVQAIGGPGADKLKANTQNDVLVGGDGDDVLDAGAGNDNVIAGNGNDRVVGGPGDDQLQAGQGIDEVDGGEGDDDIRTRDGVRDVISCGPGTDKVDADTLDQVPADGSCEDVARTQTAPPAGTVAAEKDTVAPTLKVGATTRQRLRSAGTVRLLATSSEVGSVAASGFVEIAGVRLPLPTVRRSVALAGAGVAIDLRLSATQRARARRALARGHRVRVVAAVVGTDATGNSSERAAPAIRVVR